MLSQIAWDLVFFDPLALFLLIIGLVLFFSIVLAPPPWHPRKRSSDDAAHRGSNIPRDWP